MDKVKPLGFENASLGGTETYPLPTELNPSEDFIAVKGISFENLLKKTGINKKLGYKHTEKR